MLTDILAVAIPVVIAIVVIACGAYEILHLKHCDIPPFPR